MGRNFIVAALLPAAALLATSPAQSQESSLFDPLWKAATLHKDDKAPLLNELRLTGRLHLDNYVLDAEQGSASDLVARRARLGARARLFDNLEAAVEGDFDLEGGPVFTRLTAAAGTELAGAYSPGTVIIIPGKRALQP